MNRAEELRIKLMVREAVHDELDEFYRKLAMLLDAVASSKMSPALDKTLGLLEGVELTADEIGAKRRVSRAAGAQACGKLYEMGLVQKIKKSKKVYYTKI